MYNEPLSIGGTYAHKTFIIGSSRTDKSYKGAREISLHLRRLLTDKCVHTLVTNEIETCCSAMVGTIAALLKPMSTGDSVVACQSETSFEIAVANWVVHMVKHIQQQKTAKTQRIAVHF